MIDQVACTLFRELGERHLRYAVLRNYERLPSLERDDDSGISTDIDLVVDSEDVTAFRRLAVDVAKQCGLDTVAECDHWMQSPVRAHNIEVFRFHRLSPFEMLQVDIFHGFLVLGLPLFDEEDLLQGAGQRGAVISLDRAKEAVCKMFQIHGHLRGDYVEPKVERYRQKVLAFDRECGGEIARLLRRRFWVFGVKALDALRRSCLPEFSRQIARAKLYFLCARLLREPLGTIRILWHRWRDNRMRFRTRQCGFVLRAYGPEESHRAFLRRTMEQLAHQNVMDDWCEKSPGALTAHERAVMEQGGVVVEWTGAEGADLDVPSQIGAEHLPEQIFRKRIVRHRLLYSTAAFAQLVAAVVGDGVGAGVGLL